MKLTYTCWIFLLFSFKPLFSQKRSKLDSLIRAYPSVRIDTERVNIMNHLASAYSSINLDSGLFFAGRAFDLAKRIRHNHGLFNAYINYSRALINTGKYTEAIQVSKEGLSTIDSFLNRTKNKEERKKNLSFKTSILKNLGIAYDLLAIYPEALKYYTASLKIAEALGDKKISAGNYHNIGGVYLEYEKYDEALTNFRKAYTINKAFGNKEWLTNNLTNIAIVYSSQKKYEQALETYKEALALFEEDQNSAGIQKIFSNLGSMYASLGQVDSTILYSEKVLKLNEEVGDPRNAQSAYVLLGKMYTEKGDYRKARFYLRQADPIAHELNDYGLLEDYYNAMFSIDSAQGNLLDAIHNMQLQYRYRDSVHNEDNIRKLTQTQMNFDFEKKETETKAEQEKKDAIALKELQRQRLLRNGFIGGFGVVLIFAMVFLMQRTRIGKEKKRSDELLLNILPAEVAEELKTKGNAEAKSIDDVTVLFTDFKGFTQLSEKLTPKDLIAEINECFSAFDLIMQRHGVEKIKTIGDSYMAAGGLPTPNQTHATNVVNAALDIQQYMLSYKSKKEAAGELYFEIRIGVHTGPVVAGIVGIKKFAYDIWGDTVNTASRMESSGEAGKVNISGTTYGLVKEQFICSFRGKIQAKGKGELDMYFVEARI